MAELIVLTISIIILYTLVDIWMNITYRVDLINFIFLLMLPKGIVYKLVSDDPSLIRHIINPSYKLQLIVINQSYAYLEDIRNPNPVIQMKAVENNINNLTLIEQPTEDVARYVMEHRPECARWIKSSRLPKKLQLEIKLLII